MENWRFTVLRACRQGCFSSGLGDQRSSAPSQFLRLLHPHLPCVYALILILHLPSPLMPGDAPNPAEWASFISAPSSPLYPSTIQRAWYSNCSLNVCCKTETNKPALSTLSVLHSTFPFLQYVVFGVFIKIQGAEAVQVLSGQSVFLTDLSFCLCANTMLFCCCFFFFPWSCNIISDQGRWYL